jgi:hypothetical protein
MTAWPIFQPLALVLFVTDVNNPGGIAEKRGYFKEVEGVF